VSPAIKRKAQTILSGLSKSDEARFAAVILYFCIFKAYRHSAIPNAIFFTPDVIATPILPVNHSIS
jgi:hypothetical protein